MNWKRLENSRRAASRGLKGNSLRPTEIRLRNNTVERKVLAFSSKMKGRRRRGKRPWNVLWLVAGKMSVGRVDLIITRLFRKGFWEGGGASARASSLSSSYLFARSEATFGSRASHRPHQLDGSSRWVSSLKFYFFDSTRVASSVTTFIKETIRF